MIGLGRNGHLGVYLTLNGAMLMWGLSFVATKVALETFPTFTLVFARFSLSSCLFLFLLARNGLPRFSRKDHGKLFLTALFEPGLYFVFETIGLQYTAAPKAALIIATIPITVVLFAYLFLRERTSPAGLLGIGTSLAGIVVLVAGDPQFQWALGGSLTGDLLIFGAVVSAALYMVYARNLGQKYSSLQITGMQIIYGALFYAPGFFWELPGLNWAAISGRSVAALVYLTLFATIAAFLCYNYALTRIPASRAAVFINGIPVVTALGAWLLLDETLTLLQMGGGAMVLLGVYLTNLLAERPAPVSPQEPISPGTGVKA